MKSGLQHGSSCSKRRNGGRARDTPSESGKGQRIARCPTCELGSNYGGGADKIRFVPVGTLDEPDRFPPDAHIFTASKEPWVVLPPGALVFEVFYAREKEWPLEMVAWGNAVLGK